MLLLVKVSVLAMKIKTDTHSLKEGERQVLETVQYKSNFLGFKSWFLNHDMFTLFSKMSSCDLAGPRTFR